MKKNIYYFVILLSICILLPSCRYASTATREENAIDSVKIDSINAESVQPLEANEMEKVNLDSTFEEEPIKIGSDSLIIEDSNNKNNKISFKILADSGYVSYPNEENDEGASFKGLLFVVTGVPKESNLETIQTILKKQQSYSGDPKKALAKQKKEFLDSYLEFYKEDKGAEKEYEETKKYITSWSTEPTINVLYNDNYFTTLSFISDYYGGGAHSDFHVSYLVLDLKSNKKLILRDIFDKNGLVILKQKILDKSLSIAKQQGKKTLKEAGFFEERIQPTENFIVSKSGIEFVYNRGEITLYEMPEPTYMFSWNELKDLIKVDSPLYSLIKKQ